MVAVVNRAKPGGGSDGSAEAASCAEHTWQAHGADQKMTLGFSLRCGHYTELKSFAGHDRFISFTLAAPMDLPMAFSSCVLVVSEGRYRWRAY